MHSFEYILIMIGGVLLSSLIGQRVPRISLPLIQIAIGFVLTFLPLDFNIILDPELFLVLFIAPLLFEDAKRADKAALWRHRRPVLMLAIGLVFVTTLAVGFAINLYAPSIPLAAAFALAAALAPTDAVAVSSLSATSTVSKEQGNVLKGESLLNDAASIVAFHFALAAVVTGTFSLLDATGSFLLTFFGGLAVGAVLILARYFSIRALRTSGFESTTFLVLFEVVTPCLIFLVAETLHVSGIIAVVTAGIVYSYSPRPLAPSNAKHAIVSTSVWSVITFTLNGLVFLILGTQLPGVIRHVWGSSEAASMSLPLFIVFILVAILALRFIWVLVMHRNVNLAAGDVEVAPEQAETEAVQDVGSSGSDAAYAAEAAYANDDAYAAKAVSVDDAAYAAADSGGSGDPGGFAAAGDSGGFAAAGSGGSGDSGGFGEQGQAPGLIEGFGMMDEQERDFTVERVLADERRRRKAARIERRARRREAVRAERQAAHTDPHYWRLHLYDALLLSLTGAKGAITLAVLLTIPVSLASGQLFPERDLILFLASGVIVLSLLLTNIAVPLIAPKKNDALPPESELLAILDIYRTVIYQLAESVGDADKMATNEVIRHYTNRISTMRENNDCTDPIEDALRIRVIDWDAQHTLELIDENKVSTIVGLLYLNQISHIKARIEHHNPIRWELRSIFTLIRHSMGAKKRIRQIKRTHGWAASKRLNRRTASFELRGLMFENLRYTSEQLAELCADPSSDEDTRKLAEQMIAEFQRRLNRGHTRRSPNNAQRHYEKQLLATQARALAFERDAIEAALNKGALSRERAKIMRDNVAMMELDIEDQLE